MLTMEPDNKRQRIIEHGEVFTPLGLVNDMLDLVAHECEREDSRFLEPACGDGNFLAEVLRRRLARVSQKHSMQSQWEAHALLGLACLYGIELLGDNTAICRTRLANIFGEHYKQKYASSTRPEVLNAAKYILDKNIVQGNALSMSGPSGDPLILTEWALIGRGKFKRRLYEYSELAPLHPKETSSLFAQSGQQDRDEEGNPVFIAQHLRDLPVLHYLSLASRGDEA